MQNAPAMLAQKMMNRQAPYGPVGMVSQNMSGNKKGAAAGGGGGSGVIGLKFDTATATAGVTFSNSDTTVTNTTGGNIASAKANAAVIPNTGNNWYWEFIASGPLNQFLGFGLPNFVCNAANRVGLVASSVSYVLSTGQVYANGSVQTTIATAAVGDVIGFKLQVFNPGSLLTILKNGVEILSSFDTSVWIANNSVAWTPIWSSNVTSCVATISNNIYSYAGYTPIGTATTISASASVPAVADGAYDVYTFNASGTFTVASTGAVRALVIAGGAAGANGGGGAGGYQEKGIVTTPQTYAITVGGGGPSNNTNGSNSSLGAALISTGGGTGNTSGGSGGGGYPAGGYPIGAYSASGAAGIAGQGFAGGGTSGTSTTGSDGRATGGGGGAGSVGGAGSSSGAGTGTGGAGGSGVASNITGALVTRAGGGGGFADITGGAGGSGGGGSGFFFATSTPATAGAINTGSGAGGGGGPPGGSGVVIIRVRARA